MAPAITTFHHVEIDNIGRRKRNLQPPGGESSIMFSYGNHDVQQIPRKIKFYNKSNIFGSPEPVCVSPRMAVPSPRQDTKHRLFGPPDIVPRKTVDWMKSSVFAAGPEPLRRPYSTSSLRDPELNANNMEPFVEENSERRNPITGEACEGTETRPKSVNVRKSSNPITGEGLLISRIQNNPNRQPPGGRASGIFAMSKE